MLSGRGKIRVALLTVAAISVGTSFVSLFYMNRIIKRSKSIAEKDARVAGIAEDISLKILEAKREEKNFIIYLDSTYIENNRNIISGIQTDINQAKEVAKEYTPFLDSIELLANQYRQDIEFLIKYFREDPRALSQLQRQFINYEEELKKLAKRSKIQIDSLPFLTSDLNLFMLSASTKLSTDKERLINELRETSNLILQLSREITVKSRESLAKNSAESVLYGIKAERNAMVIFIITALLLVYLLFYFPNRIFQPYRRLIRTLKAIAQGEINFAFPETQAGDELQELSHSFQDTIAKLKQFNDLKTEKIGEGVRKLRLILESINQAVIILEPDLTISYVNKTAIELFSLNSDLINKPIKEIPVLWDFLGEALSDIETKGRTECSKKIKKRDFRKKCALIIPNLNEAGKLEGILIIVK
jgi:nitrogen fixation/metabolism regulation signal transduction histidine kinase